MAAPFKAPTGTRDTLPPESRRWEALVAAFAGAAGRAGFGLLQSPTFEDLGVFERVGEGTDIVTKEMYDFEDKGGRRIALRPEGTAPVVRAYLEHHPTDPWKVWYAAPTFRYERPQAGRYRQHHQLGVEVLGSVDADVDVDVIGLAWDFLSEIGLRRINLLVNSMGEPEDRVRYADVLQAFLREHLDAIAEEDRGKVGHHPLRVLDSKRPATAAVVAGAPRPTEHLSDAATAHFERVQAGLTALGIPFTIEPRLVRGLDYYTRTTFELQAEALDAAQNAVGGGGRYDGLAEALGGPSTPGIGFGLGIERLLLAADAEGVWRESGSRVDVFVVDVTGGDLARDLTSALRRSGLGADRGFDGRSMKSQMKAADRSGARFAAIVGEDEAAAGVVTLRDLRSDRPQGQVSMDRLVDTIKTAAPRQRSGAGSGAALMTAVGMRTDWCGELTRADEGREVVLCGWVATRREHGEHLAFVDVRDRTGVIQCVVPGADDLRSEYVVKVSGTVRIRPEGTTNADLATGEVEVGDCTVEVLATADALPFPISDRIDADESLRLRHRYLDLRRSRLQTNLGVRAKVNLALRNAMAGQGFTEIETPMLIASTPEGARDFVVPSRLHPGDFYALPQSPQLFKQLCMVGGMERYFQVARCLRDEDLRADRQFEFTQLDLEASFVGEADVRAFTEIAVSAAVEAVTGEPPLTFGSITWHDAMERFGSDKPDLRFGMELVELTEVFGATEFKAFQAPCVKGIRVPGGAEKTRRELDALVEAAQSLGAKGLVWMKVDGPTEVTSPVAKFLTEVEITAVVGAVEGEAGDLVLLVADERRQVRHVLGLLRLQLGGPPVNEGGLHFLWVVDFPLFEALGDDGLPISAHHPFTMPHADDLFLLDQGGEALLDVRAQAYDLTLNGWELGSGSVRIHQPDVQRHVFALLGIDEETANDRFGFLLEAFRFGAPPHAGFAFGIDRLAALLAGEENIREVIAFPKTQSGADPLTGAPSAIADRHLTELGLRMLPPKA